MTQQKSEYEVRQEKRERCIAEGNEPFPSHTNRTIRVCDFLDQFDEKNTTSFILAGRIRLLRRHGKLSFVKIDDGSGMVQIVFSKNDLHEQYDLIEEMLDVGDIIEITGTAFVTKKEEHSLLATNVRLLSKALRPLPEKWHGLQNEEERLRKRYIDILTQPTLKELFVKKSRFWNAMRTFLLAEGFLEVETPVLETTPGGADAEPFETHHNALDIDLYLRISMGELWQKRLMIAGFEKTFEIGRQFRNEGMSPEHLQDYTQMEFYWAYADYKNGMDLVQRLYRHCAQEAFGTTFFEIKGQTLDLSKEWEMIDYVKKIEEAYGINVLDATVEQLIQSCKKEGITPEAHAGRGRLIDQLWKQCRKQITGPAFLLNHPVDVSPLAKRRADDPRTVERFQIILAGSEVGNGYSELNDPVDQQLRFEEQARLREQGDTEAQMHDADFVEALEFGMPPTCGFGVSERLFAFLADMPIRETVLFPLMKPKQVDVQEKSEE